MALTVFAVANMALFGAWPQMLTCLISTANGIDHLSSSPTRIAVMSKKFETHSASRWLLPATTETMEERNC
jgi:hypothetical protein